jgi:hypothetical protein
MKCNLCEGACECGAEWEVRARAHLRCLLPAVLTPPAPRFPELESIEAALDNYGKAA